MIIFKGVELGLDHQDKAKLTSAFQAHISNLGQKYAAASPQDMKAAFFAALSQWEKKNTKKGQSGPRFKASNRHLKATGQDK